MSMLFQLEETISNKQPLIPLWYFVNEIYVNAGTELRLSFFKAVNIVKDFVFFGKLLQLSH